MRHQLWDLLYSFDAAAHDKYILHELQEADEWDLPATSHFFLLPPQTQQRRRSKRGRTDAPRRSFNSYDSSNAMPLLPDAAATAAAAGSAAAGSNSSNRNSSRYIVFCTCNPGGQRPGQYRLYALATTAETAPDNGHTWQPADIKVAGQKTG